MWNVIPRTCSFLFILFLFILEGKLFFFGPPLHLNVHVVRPGSVLHMQGFLHTSQSNCLSSLCSLCFAYKPPFKTGTGQSYL